MRRDDRPQDVREFVSRQMDRHPEIHFEIAMWYVLADMLEIQYMTAIEKMERINITPQYQSKQAMSQIIAGHKKFREVVRRESADIQLSIGACSDAFLQVMRLVADHSKQNGDVYKIYNLVKSHTKSYKNIDLASTEQRAFEQLLSNE